MADYSILRRIEQRTNDLFAPLRRSQQALSGYERQLAAQTNALEGRLFSEELTDARLNEKREHDRKATKRAERRRIEAARNERSLIDLAGALKYATQSGVNAEKIQKEIYGGKSAEEMTRQERADATAKLYSAGSHAYKKSK